MPLPPRSTTGLRRSRKNSSISELSSLVVEAFLPDPEAFLLDPDFMAPLALLLALDERPKEPVLLGWRSTTSPGHHPLLLFALDERLLELLAPLLRPRKPKRAYFSCPVPATGPLTASRFGFSTDLSEFGLNFRDMKLNRGDLLAGAEELD